MPTIKRLKPIHYRVIEMHFSGYQNQEIAGAVGMTEPWVSTVLHQPESQEIIAALNNQTLDSMQQVHTQIQFHSNEAITTLVETMRFARSDAVRKSAAKDLLEMAGHRPMNRVSIERPDRLQEEYGKLSESEIRDKLSRIMKSDTGPDGKPLN